MSLPDKPPPVEVVPCPYCAEQIRAEAKKCRYCGEWLDKKAQAKSERELRSAHQAANQMVGLIAIIVLSVTALVLYVLIQVIPTMR